ncbi:MAG: hypothetical protein U1A72_19540 [Sulfuritalea sp.]|nr:hypothetical protein [Sulfuritalea sp.]
MSAPYPLDTVPGNPAGDIKKQGLPTEKEAGPEKFGALAGIELHLPTLVNPERVTTEVKLLPALLPVSNCLGCISSMANEDVEKPPEG